MSGTFRLLIHARLHEALQKEARPWLAPLAKTLSLLQLGYWGGGTRVKKLRGYAKPVFEARLNDADRVIFTLAHTASSEPPHDPVPHLLVWDILAHDAVERRRFNPQPEASFVEFPALTDCAVETPPAEVPGPVADSVSPSALLRSLETPSGERRDDIGEAIRWYILDPSWVLDDASWQAVLDTGGSDVELKLTREQYDVLAQRGPVLLSGAAGSGKTTLTVHWLARHSAGQPGARVLYVTYSDLLLEQVRSSFRNLLGLRGITAAAEPAFLTFPDLYRHLSGQSQAPVRFPFFADWYTRMTSRTDAALAWEEIRGIQKGACLDPERTALPREEYEALGRKRAPLFVGERPRLFAIGQRYQQWLTAERRVDDIDLARAAWRAVKGRPAAYDAIVCDEVQDLTEIEMNLLLDLCRDSTFGGLLATGDPQQIVNPSGFRWADLRSVFLRKFRASGQAVPEIRRLTRNFRSVRGIIALANAFLAVQRSRTGRSDDDFTEEGVTHGPAPFVVQGAPAAVLEAVRQFGPRCAVIVARAEQAEQLRRDLGSTRVFDVASSKGLEFDVVVLWNLMGPDVSVWRDILTGTAPGKEDPVMRRVLHHAYVAVTRARQWLAVFESGPAAELWHTPALRACLEQDTAAALQAVLATSASPDQWAREADYYAERRRFLQAAECYRRAGRHDEAEFAEARGLEEAGRFREAADRYLRLDRKLEAAEAATKAGEAEQAAGWFRELGLVDRAEAVLLDHWTRTGAWSRAAELHEKRGELSAAAEAYGKAGQPAHAARLRILAATKSGDWTEVGRLEAERHHWAAAAEAYGRAGLTRDVARCQAHQAEHEGNPTRAAELWRAAGDEERARQLVASTEDLARRALALERNDSHSLRRAMMLWQQLQAVQPSPATATRIRALEAELKLNWREAAERFHEIRAWSGVRRVAHSATSDNRELRDEEGFARLRQVWCLRDSAMIHEWEDLKGTAAAVRFAAQMPQQTHIRKIRAELGEKAGLWADAARTYVALGQPEDARRCADRTGDPQLSAELDALAAEKEGRYAEAEVAWLAAGNTRKAMASKARALEAAGAMTEAAAAWEQAGQRAKANRLRKRLMSEARRASGRQVPTGKSRTEAMIDYVTQHPGCSRKEVQDALGLTTGEALPALYQIEVDPRVSCYRQGNRYVYGPAGWVAKSGHPVLPFGDGTPIFAGPDTTGGQTSDNPLGKSPELDQNPRDRSNTAP